MIGSLTLIALAALSGLSLDLSPTALLAMHLAAAASAAGVLAAFLTRHWWPRRGSLSHHPNSPLGYLATAMLGLLTVSGVALLWATNVEPLRHAHSVATYALVALLGTHSLWRIVRRTMSRSSGRAARPIGPAWRAGLLLPAALVILVVVPVAASKTISPPAAQPLARVGHATLGESNLPQVADCTGCHSDATQQWRSSPMPRLSPTNTTWRWPRSSSRSAGWRRSATARPATTRWA